MSGSCEAGCQFLDGEQWCVTCGRESTPCSAAEAVAITESSAQWGWPEWFFRDGERYPVVVVQWLPFTQRDGKRRHWVMENRTVYVSRAGFHELKRLADATINRSPITKA